MNWYDQALAVVFKGCGGIISDPGIVAAGVHGAPAPQAYAIPSKAVAGGLPCKIPPASVVPAPQLPCEMGSVHPELELQVLYGVTLPAPLVGNSSCQ